MPNVKRVLRRWSDKDKVKLRELWRYLKWGPTRVHQSRQFPDRTLDSIEGQYRELGLGDPVHKSIIRNARRLSTTERATLEKFLQGEGRKMPSGAVTAKLGHKPRVIFYYRRKLGLQLSWEEARDTEVYRDSRKSKEAARKRTTGFRTYLRELWRERRTELEALYRKMDQSGNTLERKMCATCRQWRFATQEFFYSWSQKQPDGTVAAGLYSYCRACGLPWQRNRPRRKKA